MIIKINNFRGDLSDISAVTATMSVSSTTDTIHCALLVEWQADPRASPNPLKKLNYHLNTGTQPMAKFSCDKGLSPVLAKIMLFSKSNQFIFGYFDPIHIFFDDKHN